MRNISGMGLMMQAAEESRQYQPVEQLDSLMETAQASMPKPKSKPLPYNYKEASICGCCASASISGFEGDGSFTITSEQLTEYYDEWVRHQGRAFADDYIREVYGVASPSDFRGYEDVVKAKIEKVKKVVRERGKSFIVCTVNTRQRKVLAVLKECGFIDSPWMYRDPKVTNYTTGVKVLFCPVNPELNVEE